MNDLKVIQGGLESKQDKRVKRVEIELDAYERMIAKLSLESHLIGTQGLSMVDEQLKLIHTVIRFVNLMSDEDRTARYDTVLEFYHLIADAMRGVPVADFVRWFPIKKKYDGDRWGVKDYYSTMDFLKENGYLSEGATINDSYEFLMEYHNPLVFQFAFRGVLATSDSCRARGEEEPFEQFCRENDIPVQVITKLPNGKKSLTDDKGNQRIISKAKPRHLKIVQGGRK